MPSFNRAKQRYDQFGRKIYSKTDGGLNKYLNDFGQVLIFDSKSEYETWLKLAELESRGLISDLKLQVTFELIPACRWYNNVKDKWEAIRKTEYVADFTFIKDGKLHAMDCKGWKLVKNRKTGKVAWKAYKDDIYILKKKLFLNKYPEIIFQEA